MLDAHDAQPALKKMSYLRGSKELREVKNKRDWRIEPFGAPKKACKLVKLSITINKLGDIK